jgi:CRISPR/Cas system-associated exonuclease Cas4 (RecB family)
MMIMVTKTLPKEHLSYSQVNMFLRCPKQYYYRYLEGLVMPPSGSLVLGSSGHKSLEHNYSQKIDTKKDLKAKEVLEYFDATFEEQAKEDVDWGDKKKGDYKDAGARTLKKYQKDYAPAIQPEAVEQEFNIELENADYTLKGYIDLITEGGDIVDHKISGRKPSNIDDKQLTVYRLAYKELNGFPPEKVRFDYLVTKKSPEIIPFEMDITDEDEQELLELIGDVSEAIKSGIFYRRTDGWMCNPKYCGYYYKCRPHKEQSFYDFTREVSD